MLATVAQKIANIEYRRKILARYWFGYKFEVFWSATYFRLLESWIRKITNIKCRCIILAILLFLPHVIRNTPRQRRWGLNSYQIGWDPNRGWLFSWFHWWVSSQKISPPFLSSQVWWKDTYWSHPPMRSSLILSLTPFLEVFPLGRRPGWWNYVNSSLFPCLGISWF